MKKIVCGILLALLSAILITGAFNVQSTKANASSQGETAQAADPDWWPMFHHDLDHTGYSTSTGPTTNNTLWNYTTINGVLSSPAVVDGLVYVGSYDDNVYCLNAATGTQVWNYTTGGPVYSSPAVVNGVVYIGTNGAGGKIYAFGSSPLVTTYTLTITPPVGSGSVAVNNSGPYQYGDVVQLTANANSGWAFTGWSGDLTGTTSPTTITMDGNITITATFSIVFVIPVLPLGTLTAVFSMLAVLAGYVRIRRYRFAPATTGRSGKEPR